MQNKVLSRPCYNRSGPQMNERMHIRSSVDNRALGGNYDYDGRVCYTSEGHAEIRADRGTVCVKTALLICGAALLLMMALFLHAVIKQNRVRLDIRRETEYIWGVQQHIAEQQQTIREETTMSKICTRAAQKLGMVSNEGVEIIYLQVPAGQTPDFPPIFFGGESAWNR